MRAWTDNLAFTRFDGLLSTPPLGHVESAPRGIDSDTLGLPLIELTTLGKAGEDFVGGCHSGFDRIASVRKQNDAKFMSRDKGNIRPEAVCRSGLVYHDVIFRLTWRVECKHRVRLEDNL